MRVLASLLLVTAIAACGDDGNVRHVPDASPGADAPITPDGPPQPVTVTISRFGAPMKGIVVYFQNADSSLVKEAMTDATGTASTLMAAGGSVTAIDPFFNQPAGVQSDEIYTWQGVKPGDHLVLANEQRPGITVNVIVPIDTGATTPNYRFYSTCSYDTSGDFLTAPGGSDTTASATISLYGCGATADVLVTSDVDGTLQHFIYKTNVAVADQGTIDLTAETYAAPTDRTYTFNNASGDYNLDSRELVGSGNGQLWEHYFNTSSTGGTTTAPVPAFTGATSVVSTTQLAPAGISNRRELVWGPLAAPFTVDWNANLLPELTAFPQSDVASRSVTWTEGGGAQQPSFTLLAVSAQRETPPRFWQWFIATPHTAGEVKFPVLPTDVFDFNFTTGDSVYVDGLALAQVPGGYDAARPVIFTTQGPEDLAVGPSGTASTTELAPQLRTAPPTGKSPKAQPSRWRMQRRR